jgi:accessory gene regulator protein AgrB
MITLLAGVLIALSGYIISDWKGMASASHKDVVAIIGSLYSIALSIYMIKNVLPNNYYVLGSEPEVLMNPGFFESAVQTDKITVFIYMNEIENYNLRIEKNLEVNTNRWGDTASRSMPW